MTENALLKALRSKGDLDLSMERVDYKLRVTNRVTGDYLTSVPTKSYTGGIQEVFDHEFVSVNDGKRFLLHVDRHGKNYKDGLREGRHRFVLWHDSVNQFDGLTNTELTEALERIFPFFEPMWSAGNSTKSRTTLEFRDVCISNMESVR